MKEGFRDLLPELRPFIPRALVDEEGLERLAERVGHLPGMATARLTALEVRLRDPSCTVDCSVPVGWGSPLMPHYVKRGEAAAPDSAAARLARLLARQDRSKFTASSRPANAKALAGVLLEYDIVGIPPQTRPEPGVFLCLKYQPDQSLNLAAATDVLFETVGWAHQGVRDAVDRVFRVLPAMAGIPNIGAMPDRSPQAIKLVVVGIDAAKTRDFLERAGWPGSMCEVERVMEAMAPVSSRLALSLDVANQGLLPRVGLEFSPPAMEKGGKAWKPLIERIAELGWCLPGKERALIAFPGTERVFRDDGLFVLYKGINHLKLTLGNDDVQVKAYIGFSYLPFSATPGHSR